MRQVFFILLLCPMLWPMAQALELNDKFKVRIIGKHPENVVVLNRGKEDGIEFGDHAKITLPNGFIARLINFKSEPDRSYWKVYRIVYPEYLSRVHIYDLHSLKLSEIPENYQELLVDRGPALISKDQVTIFDPDFRETKTLVDDDLPQDLSKDEEVLDSQKNLYHKLTDKDKWRRDTRKFQFSAYTSPFSQETTSKLTQHNFGADLSNTHYKRYQVKLGFQSYGISLQDPNTKQQANISRTRLNGRVEYAGFERRTRYFSEVDYFVQKQGNLDTLNPQVRVGPLGIIKEFNKSDYVTAMEIGYIPMIEKRSSDMVDRQTHTISSSNKTGIRHSARWRMKFVKNHFSLENLFMVQPMMSGISIDSQDLDMQNRAIIAYNPNKHFTLEYMNQFINDGRQKTLANLPQTNFIHSLNIRLNVDL